MGNFFKGFILIFLLVNGNICESFRILVLFTIPSGSHAILGDACVKVLLDAGHEVVYVTTSPNRLQIHPNYVEVDVSSNAKYFPMNMLSVSNILNNPANPPSINGFLELATNLAAETVKHEAFQTVLNGEKKFDLVIAEWMFTEIYAGLPALLDCPLIWISSMEPHSTILSLVDEAPNPAYNADPIFTLMTPYTFFQRVEQLVMHLYYATYKLYYVYFKETPIFINLFTPIMEKLGKTLPAYDDLRYNASLVLSNSHVSLGEATRLPQNFIPIGGYHIDPQTEPLSEDLMNIFNNSPNGVVYFSMGSILKSKDLPQKVKMALLDMFGSLNQTVIWKFEEDFPNLPDNVHVLKWASQQSILNHPNCVLFITHGGLLSLTESIHFGVPIIGVPAFGDQFVNVIRAERKGFALKVDLSYNLAKDLKEAIAEIMENPKYREKVKELSFAYHDRPVHPRRELVHWVEHVIKSRGAPLLQSPALKLPFYQKIYLDLAVLILVIVYVLKYIVKRFIYLFRGVHKDNALETKKVN